MNIASSLELFLVLIVGILMKDPTFFTVDCLNYKNITFALKLDLIIGIFLFYQLHNSHLFIMKMLMMLHKLTREAFTKCLAETPELVPITQFIKLI